MQRGPRAFGTQEQSLSLLAMETKAGYLEHLAGRWGPGFIRSNYKVSYLKLSLHFQ